MEQNTIIKQVCKELGLTQKELASEIGVSEITMKKWATGANKIPNWGFKVIEYYKKLKENNII